MTAGAPATATNFSFSGPASAKLGSSFELSLQVQPGQPINAIPFTISYDPKSLSVTAVVEGDLMRQGGAPASFSSRIDSIAGRIFASAARPANVAGATQPGTLVTLKLQALSATTPTGLQLLQAQAQDINGKPLTTQLPTPWIITITP